MAWLWQFQSKDSILVWPHVPNYNGEIEWHLRKHSWPPPCPPPPNEGVWNQRLKIYHNHNWLSTTLIYLSIIKIRLTTRSTPPLKKSIIIILLYPHLILCYNNSAFKEQTTSSDSAHSFVSELYILERKEVWGGLPVKQGFFCTIPTTLEFIRTQQVSCQWHKE